VHVDHSKSQPMDDKLSLKGAWSLSRVLFHFWKISDNISKTVQDSIVVSIKFESEVVCSLSDGYVADDLGLPTTTLNHPSFTFCVALCIFVIDDRKDFKFDVQMECASHSLRTTNRP